MDPQSSTVLVVLIVLALIAIGGWMFHRKRESERLAKRFGPEYGHAVESMGSRTKAEAELKAREKRVAKFRIVALPPAEAARFAQQWRSLQTRFIDNPKGVVTEADLLVSELMLKRGYPMADFDRLSADISVDHPRVVEHYRAARRIAERDHRGQADTEDLRKAVVHYRVLFDDLLEVDRRADRPAQAAQRPVEAQR
jgi:hypothetical protein